MKKIFLIIGICIFVVCGCKSTSVNDSKIYEGDSAKEVSMIIKEGTLSKTSATVIITDNSHNYKDNAYNVTYQLYRKQDNQWISLEFITDNVSTTLKNYFVNEERQIEMQQNWEKIYGELSAGEYKIVKYFTNLENNQSFTFSTDFVI